MRALWLSLFGVTVAFASSVAACSEGPTTSGLGNGSGSSSGSSGGSSGGGSGSSSGGSSGGGSGSSSGGGSGSSSGGTGMTDGGLVINEMNGKGSDYIELYNASGAAIDLSQWGIADEDRDAGTASQSDVAAFPAGTMLAANGYALVNGAPKGDAGPGACPVAACIAATWNISASKGETIYIVDATGTAVSNASLPANMTGSGQSWGRLPDGTGAFALNRQTPGAANQGP